MAMDFKASMASAGAVVKRIAARLWRYLKVAKMEYIVMISLFAIDLISKAIINAVMRVGHTVVLIPKFLQFTNIHNYNAAFGNSAISSALGSIGSRILFSAFAVAASTVFIILLVKNKGGHPLYRISLAMLVAGAMGNCIDRMFLGYVRDFIEFVYFGLTIFGNKSFYVFNIADAALVVGVVLVIVYFIFLYRDDDERKKKELEKSVAVLSQPTETTSKPAETENSDTSAAQLNPENADGVESVYKPESSSSALVDEDYAEHDGEQPETMDGNDCAVQTAAASDETNRVADSKAVLGTDDIVSDASQLGAAVSDTGGDSSVLVSNPEENRKLATQKSDKSEVVQPSKVAIKSNASHAPKAAATKKPAATSKTSNSGTAKPTTKRVTSGNTLSKTTGTKTAVAKISPKRTTTAKNTAASAEKSATSNENADNTESKEGGV